MTAVLDDVAGPAEDEQEQPSGRPWRERLIPLGALGATLLLVLVVPAREGSEGGIAVAGGFTEPVQELAAPGAVAAPAASTDPMAPQEQVPVVAAPPYGDLVGGGFPELTFAGDPPPPPQNSAPEPAFDPPAEQPGREPVAAPPLAVPAAPATPLTVRESGWADANPSLPSTQPAVPENGLPVAVDATGQDQRRSFVRLAGGSTELRLQIGEAAAQNTPNAATVRACPITAATWKPARNQSFADAPAYDATTCVTAVREGSLLVFDLASYGDPAQRPGFALVPAAPAPGAPYQLVLRAR